MKRFALSAAVAAALIIGVSIYAVETGYGKTETESTVSAKETESADDGYTIVIPENNESSDITISASEGTSFTASARGGKTYSITENDSVTVPFSKNWTITDLSDEAQASLSSENTYTAFKVSNAESVNIDLSHGVTLDGDKYDYVLTMTPKKSAKKINISGSLTGSMTAGYSGKDILLDSSLVLGNITVAPENVGTHSYLVNSTSCVVHADGTVTLENGTAVSPLSDENLENKGITSVQNVFHTISPALFVSGSLAEAESLINDYVYGDEKTASALGDGAVSKSIQYYGETGSLLFTITVFENGNHARISTSDGEVHDYIMEAQEGAHCYPVFCL